MIQSPPIDFVLFPRDREGRETYSQSLREEFGSLPQSSMIMANAHHLQSPNYAHDPYNSLSPYFSAAPADAGAQHPKYNLTKADCGISGPQPTPSTSPSSLSQPHDHPSSNLSSASGTSGASGQSTGSSVSCSPYSHPTSHLPHLEEKWTAPLHGLGLGPEIGNSETFGPHSYHTNNLDAEMMLDDSKYQTFVGEYQESVSSSLISSCQDLGPQFPSGSATKNASLSFPSPPLISDASANSRDITIDSILEEVNETTKSQTALISPTSVSVSAMASTTIPSSSPVSVRGSLFRSPVIPASAASQSLSHTASTPTSPSVAGTQSLGINAHGNIISSPTASHNTFQFAQDHDIFFDQRSERLGTLHDPSCRFSSSRFCSFRPHCC